MTFFKDSQEAINADINGRSFTQWHNSKYVCIGEPMTVEEAQKFTEETSIKIMPGGKIEKLR